LIAVIFKRESESMKGFYNQILRIDLTTRSFEITSLTDEILLTYLGGKGLASYLLYRLNPAGVDPLSPDNVLIFATGPVAGSSIWGSCRYGVFTKSPQTGFYSESYSGGKVPEAIDATGFDAIVIQGRNERPGILCIYPEGADFYDADDIWGMDTFDTEDAVIRRFGRRGSGRVGAVVIGPAGENLVRFSVIENDYWRSAGRTGVGTVMGSKRLKAVVFQGDRHRPLYDEKAVRQYAKDLASRAKDNPGVKAYKAMGTPMMVKIMNEAGAFPTRYWSEGTYAEWDKISADALHTRCEVKPSACLKCLMACGRKTRVLHGRHTGLEIEGPEYETIYAFGGLCMVNSIEEIAYLNDICDRLGMDTISAGNLCGFAIEAVKRGKIDHDVDYGDVDAIASLLQQIARREGIGDILAQGIRHASETWGLEDIAVHVKGLEPAGYDPRVLKGVGLGYATSDRGACHLRATFYKPELSGMIDPHSVENKAQLFVDFEDRLTLFDALILCRFYRDLYPWDELSSLIYITTGKRTTQEELKATASAISDVVRHFNIREGLTPEDDQLPERLHREFLKSGHHIKREELAFMRSEYYHLRGWDENGRPPMPTETHHL
jgi:aldehyde:ferredoxin oxidoreductase